MPQVIQIVGFKNSGKTTLAEFLVAYFSGKGIKVGVIKHDGHEFEIDHAGTDSWRMAMAGAAAVAVTSAHKTAIVEQLGSTLESLITRFSGMDLIVVEGFKKEHHPKVVMLRKPEDVSLVQASSAVKAVVCWDDVPFTTKFHAAESQLDAVRAFKRDEQIQIAEWLIKAFQLPAHRAGSDEQV